MLGVELGGVVVAVVAEAFAAGVASARSNCMRRFRIILALRLLELVIVLLITINIILTILRLLTRNLSK